MSTPPSSGLPKALLGVDAKMRRALEHRQQLLGEIDVFVESDSHSIRSKKFGEGFQHSWYMTFDPRPDWTKWGVLFGDMLHNLRSALDHLAWQLVRVNGHQPDSRTTFPIFYDQKEFLPKGRATRAMRGMSPEVQARIKGLQPFDPDGKEPEDKALWLLRELNNYDKHRIVTPCVLATGGGTVGHPTGCTIEWAGTVDEGAPFMTVYSPVACDEVPVKIDATLQIGVDVGPLMFPLNDIVEKLGKAVDATIQRFFDQF